MNLANKITMTRIFLVPIFVLFLTSIPKNIINTYLNFHLTYQNSLYIATFIFIVASITDKLDGYIARKYNQITNLGKLLDPLADKLMVACALIYFVGARKTAAWIVILILGREFAITGFRLIAVKSNKVLAADNFGKLKTVIQIIAIILTLLDNYPLNVAVDLPFSDIAMIFALIITVISGVNYIIRNKEVLMMASAS